MVDHVPMLDEVTVRDEVIGGSGVRLSVRTSGPTAGPPVVLLHGWAQSSRVWVHQLTGPLANSFRLIAADMRGHGDSEVPAGGYDSGAEWAADVRALLDYACRPAVIVGWSYGGLLIADYLRHHGTAGVAGLVFVGAVTEIGRGHPGGRVGPVLRDVLPEALSDDPTVAGPALRAFATGMEEHPNPSPFETALIEDSMRVPGWVRSAMFNRDQANDDVLAAIDVPTLVLHGRHDTVALPSIADYTAGLVPGARLIWFDHVGHVPFAEQIDLFDTTLADHLNRSFAGGAA